MSNVPTCSTADPDLWLSSNRGDRMRAADLCRTCPIRQDCYAEAEELRTRPFALGVNPAEETTWRPWGVWAGLSYDGKGGEPRPVPAPAHGLRRYRAGCRCEQCAAARDADTERLRAYRRGAA